MLNAGEVVIFCADTPHRIVVVAADQWYVLLPLSALNPVTFR